MPLRESKLTSMLKKQNSAEEMPEKNLDEICKELDKKKKEVKKKKTGQIDMKKKKASLPTMPERAQLTSVEDVDEEIYAEKKKKTLRKGDIDLDKYLIKLQKVGLKDKIFFTKNLGVMLKAGLSLGKSLKALAAQTPNALFKKILKEVSEKVNKGNTFADSLAEYPKTFPPLFVSMIRSGEEAGNLEEVLKQLHKQMSRDHDLISKVRGAMIYPIIVITAMIGIGIGMIVFVIPKFITIFEEVNTELPLATRILIKISHLVSSYGLIILLVVIVLVTLFILGIRQPKGKKILHKFFLKAPILGSITKKINLARFSRTLSSMLKTSIPIVDAFEITADVLGNVHYSSALKDVSKKIQKGAKVNKTLLEYRELFPPVVIQMISVGEESGSLEDILIELANFYEDDIDQTMKNLPTIIEPVLMVILGLGVGAMAVAVLMPMYSLSEAI